MNLKTALILLLLSAVSFATEPLPACENNILQVALNKMSNNAMLTFFAGIIIFLADGRKEGIGFVGVIGIALATIGLKYLLGM